MSSEGRKNRREARSALQSADDVVLAAQERQAPFLGEIGAAAGRATEQPLISQMQLAQILAQAQEGLQGTANRSGLGNRGRLEQGPAQANLGRIGQAEAGQLNTQNALASLPLMLGLIAAQQQLPLARMGVQTQGAGIRAQQGLQTGVDARGLGSGLVGLLSGAGVFDNEQ